VNRLAVANLVPAVRAVATAATILPTIVVIAAATTAGAEGIAAATTAGAEGIAAAAIRAETDAMIAAPGAAVKAEDLGPTAVRDKAVGTRTVMAAEIVAIAPLRITPRTPQFATGAVTLIRIKMLAIATVIGTRTRIVTRTATATGTKTEFATRTVIRIKTRIVTGTATRTRIGTAIRIKTKIVAAIGTKIRTKTEIAGVTGATAAIADTIDTPPMTTRLLTNPATTATILIAKAPMNAAMRTVCTPEPMTVAVDSPTIPSVRTFSGMATMVTTRPLAVEISTSGPIAMVSCKAIRRAIRIGKGISAVDFSTASDFELRLERKSG
jgi:hypothetical protein